MTTIVTNYIILGITIVIALLCYAAILLALVCNKRVMKWMTKYMMKVSEELEEELDEEEDD